MKVSTPPKRAWRYAAVALAASIGVAACGSSHHSASPTTTAGGGGASTSTTVASPTTTTSATTIPTTTVPASTTPTTASGPSLCLTSQLSGSLGPANAAAGTVYYSLVLTNSGATSCIIQGYPGVSFVAGGSGAQVGASAARIPGAAPSITLAPGKSASAILGIVDAGNYGTSCQLTQAAGLRVYPPGQTAALFIAHTDRACANRADVVLNIRPLASS